jgi:hypothetical protein
MGTGKTVLVTVLVIAGLLMLALSFVASIVVDTIDQRIADECEDETGTIGEIIGADEGQCQDGRDMSDRVDSIGQMIGYLGAAILVISVIMVAIRKRQ